MSSLSHIDLDTVILIALFAVFLIVALITSPILLIIVLVALLICIYLPQSRPLLVGFLVILFSLPLYVIISILPLDPALRVILQVAVYAILLFITFFYVIREYEKRVRRVRAEIK